MQQSSQRPDIAATLGIAANDIGGGDIDDELLNDQRQEGLQVLGGRHLLADERVVASG